MDLHGDNCFLFSSLFLLQQLLHFHSSVLEHQWLLLWLFFTSPSAVHDEAPVFPEG